ncbi:MAG TPA: serine hydrolase domain-containing protein, partial [Puia sp.]|nr:serine hydrolase domain-containing protein [Puia sp.]
MKKLIGILLLPVLAMGQKNESRLLDQYMQAQASVKQFSGTVLVIRHDHVLLKAAYGLADREWNVANTVQTKFRIGSITKQFTAACILQLVEQGKLNLDDRLSKFIPGFPKGDSVSIDMLLNHTSGIPSYTSQPDFGKYSRLSLSKDSMISYFKNRPYDFPPGTKFQYDNSGYFLLGYIIEKVSGESYESYLRGHILDVLGMKNTGADRLDSILPWRARGYTRNHQQFFNAPYISMDWPFSAGELYSTVEDLYTWDRSLYGNRVLTAASREKMFRPGKGNYGYGVFIDSVEKHFRISHGGSIPGFVSKIDRYVNDDICIIILSNDEAATDFISLALADILFGIPVEVAYQ